MRAILRRLFSDVYGRLFGLDSYPQCPGSEVSTKEVRWYFSRPNVSESGQDPKLERVVAMFFPRGEDGASVSTDGHESGRDRDSLILAGLAVSRTSVTPKHGRY